MTLQEFGLNSYDNRNKHSNKLSKQEKRLNYKFLNQSAVAKFGDREANLILESALMVSTTLPTVITFF